MSRYFCHNCNIRLERINEDFTCPTCSSGFIEELDESHHQHQGHAQGLDFSGQQGLNPLDFLSLLGFSSGGGGGGGGFHQPRSQSHPSSPTGAGAAGGLSGGTPNTLAGAAAASAAAGANSQNNPRGRQPSRRGAYHHHHGPHFSFVIDGRQVAAGGGGGAGGGTGGEGAMENMFLSFLSDLITGLGGGIPLQGNINLGDYAWGREGLDAIVTQLMNNMEGTGPPPMAEDKLANLTRSNVTQEQVNGKLQCSVCWEDFALNDNVIRLECEHIFHPDCILPWLKLHATCPVCRKDLNGMPEEMTKQSEAEGIDSMMNNSQQAGAAATSASTTTSSTSPPTSSSSSRPYRALDEDMEFD